MNTGSVARTDKQAAIQELATALSSESNHRGVAKVLRRLSDLKSSNPNFQKIQIDNQREFWEAVRLEEFESPDSGLAEITNRRRYLRPKPPAKAISTIHKAKGLECDNVLLMPCDARNFPDRPEARCLLYVALSRAKKGLLLVVPRSNPSPLLII